jgi:hypothetical protein
LNTSGVSLPTQRDKKNQTVKAFLLFLKKIVFDLFNMFLFRFEKSVIFFLKVKLFLFKNIRTLSFFLYKLFFI